MACWTIKINRKSGIKEFQYYDPKTAERHKKSAIELWGKENVEVFIDGEKLEDLDLRLY